tara:strand:- start:266 stop:481 length:216 start_codon:yes stop_codon:yes gene_type:complete
MPKSNKRTIKIDGHVTSVFLETEFWQEILKLSKKKNTTPDKIISTIDKNKNTSNLSSAIRLYILNHLKSQL